MLRADRNGVEPAAANHRETLWIKGWDDSPRGVSVPCHRFPACQIAEHCRFCRNPHRHEDPSVKFGSTLTV